MKFSARKACYGEEYERISVHTLHTLCWIWVKFGINDLHMMLFSI
jgi:hypothetical protein